MRCSLNLNLGGITEKEKQWLNSFKVIASQYVSTITKFIYHARFFEGKYLQLSLKDKKDSSTLAGEKFEYIRELTEQATLIACEIDLNLDSSNEELIYLIDYFTKNSTWLLGEYMTVQSEDDLLKLVYENIISDTDDVGEIFTKEEMN